MLQKLKEQFQIEMTYNSNGIEGNTLTLNETYWVFQEGITVKGKTLKEHLEVKDHKRALQRLYQLVESPTDIDFSEKLIKDLHQSVIELSEEQDDFDYRNSDVFIAGSDHKPLTPKDVGPAIKKLITWLHKESHQYHIIETAALFHHQFVHIHPF